MRTRVNRWAKPIASIGIMLLLLATAAPAQVLFSSDMDTNEGWMISISEDIDWEFGWDFTQMGIPPSPGGSTTGLMMKANLSYGWGNAYVMAYPTWALSELTGQYTVEFDFWINVNGPFPGGGAGSTEFIGGCVGMSDSWVTWPDVPFGASLLIDGEGGDVADWRLYKEYQVQWLGSFEYDIDDWDVGPSGSLDLATWFPGHEPPAYQQANYSQQTGAVYDGSGGFAWHHMIITVDTEAIGAGPNTDPGLANFCVDGLSIGTIDNSIIGPDQFPVCMSWGAGVMYVDLYPSISDNPDLSFGVVDNFVVRRIVIPDFTEDSIPVGPRPHLDETPFP